MKNNIYEQKRQFLLEQYRKKQPFRVAIGKSTWHPYNTFNPAFNLREILKDEIVIEFDTDNLEACMRAISSTGLALYNAGYYFEWWDHGGRSPHLHIKNLEIPQEILSDKDKLRAFKKAFIKTYVSPEYHGIVDIGLAGIHLIAIEFAQHWKGKYGIKKLVSCFDGQNKNSWGVL